MEHIILSIIIPVYNIRDYIGRCLDSLIDQDIEKNLYEIICIDDGSSDGSCNILEEYKKKCSNLNVVHTENRGVVLARSTGLELAKGKYIWFVDGDDWIKRNCLKYLSEAILNGENDLLLFREKRVIEYCNDDTDLYKYKPEYYNGGYKTFDSHYTTGSGFYWFSKKILDDYNIRYRPDIYYSDDTLFIAKFKARCKRMVITEAPIYFYFQRSDSVSHSVNYSRHCGCMYKLAKEYKKMSETQFELYDETNTNLRMKNAQIRAMQSCIRNILMFCQDKSFLKAFLNRSKSEGYYPFGVDWKQLKIDKRQSRKNDVLNWVFAFVSFEPYLWLLWLLFKPIRSQKGIPTFDMKEFDDAF